MDFVKEPKMQGQEQAVLRWIHPQTPTIVTWQWIPGLCYFSSI